MAFGAADSIYALAPSGGDGYVAKLDPTGALAFSTLVGGRNQDEVSTVAFASNGDILIGGTTQSDDLLAQAGAPTRNNGALEQGFLARLSSDGSALLGFRYMGGSTTDSISRIVFLSSGELAVAGFSESPDLSDVVPDAFPDLCCRAFLGVYTSDSFAPHFVTFLEDASAPALVAAAGIRVYFSGGNSIGAKLNGVPLVCEDPNAVFCKGLILAVDLAP